MAKGKKKSKAKGKGKTKSTVKLAAVEETIPVAKQLSSSVTKEIGKKESSSQRPASVDVPGLGRIIPIPGSEPVTTPLCKPQCSGTNVPVCYPPTEPCCPLLEKELYLDPEQEQGEEEESDIAVQGYIPKPPKIVLGDDGEPKLESDSDSEPEEICIRRPRSPPEVHITPPMLMQRNEFLYHVHVIGEDGLLEVDRLDANHPLPNCRLREIETENEWMKYFPDGYVTGICCSEIFESDSEESMEVLDKSYEPPTPSPPPEIEECEEPVETKQHSEFRKSEPPRSPSRGSSPRKSSPRKSSPRKSSPRKSSPRKSSPRKSRESSPRTPSPRKSRQSRKSGEP